MDKKLKSYRLSDDTLNLIQETKEQFNFRNDTQALEYIICNSTREIKKGNTQMREMEKQIELLFEMLNSLLIHAECNKFYNFDSKVVKEAKEHLKEERAKLRTKKLTQENIV